MLDSILNVVNSPISGPFSLFAFPRVPEKKTSPFVRPHPTSHTARFGLLDTFCPAPFIRKLITPSLSPNKRQVRRWINPF